MVELETITGYTTGEAVPTVGLVNTFTITNTLTNPLETEVTVTKKWVDDENSQKTRPNPEEVTVTLTGTVEGTDYSKTYTEKLNEDNSWTYTFTKLPKNEKGEEIQYSVKEEVPENYTATTSGDMTTGYTITNTIS